MSTHRTAQPAYPCFVSDLGEFSGSKSCALTGRKDNFFSKKYQAYLFLFLGMISVCSPK
jgi:hypothetical protein